MELVAKRYIKIGKVSAFYSRFFSWFSSLQTGLGITVKTMPLEYRFGGIGRRAWLRTTFFGVRVQVSESVPWMLLPSRKANVAVFMIRLDNAVTYHNVLNIVGLKIVYK